MAYNTNYNDDYVEINGSKCPHSHTLQGTIEIWDSKYVHITGLTINYAAQGGITLWTGTCSFITINNCTISNCAAFAFKSFNLW